MTTAAQHCTARLRPSTVCGVHALTGEEWREAMLSTVDEEVYAE